jgi:hypothetical protein
MPCVKCEGMRRKAKEISLFVLFLIAVPLLSPIPVGTLVAPLDPRGDELDKAMRHRVGYTKDCGDIPEKGDRSAAEVCATTAYKDKKPFHMRWVEADEREPGVVNEDFEYLVYAIAGTSEGRIYVFYYQPNAPGGHPDGPVYEVPCTGSSAGDYGCIMASAIQSQSIEH